MTRRDINEENIVRQGLASAALEDGAVSGQVASVTDGELEFVDAGGGSQPFSGVEVHLANDLAGLDVNTPQEITYDLAAYDTDDYFDPLAPKGVTIPNDGIYLVTSSIDGIDATGGIDGNAYASVIYSGSGVVTPEQVAPYDGTEQTFGLIMTNVVKLVAGTFCTPLVNLRIAGGTTFTLYKENTHLTVTKLGELP